MGNNTNTKARRTAQETAEQHARTQRNKLAEKSRLAEKLARHPEQPLIITERMKRRAGLIKLRIAGHGLPAVSNQALMLERAIQHNLANQFKRNEQIDRAYAELAEQVNEGGH